MQVNRAIFQLVRLLVRPSKKVVQVLRTTSVTSAGPVSRLREQEQSLTVGPLTGPVWYKGIKWYWSGPGVCLRTPPTDHLYQRANFVTNDGGMNYGT